jgi:hypothetical protein
MIAPQTLHPLVEAVRVADLRAYLLGKGWRIKPFKQPQVIYFEGRQTMKESPSSSSYPRPSGSGIMPSGPKRLSPR